MSSLIFTVIRLASNLNSAPVCWWGALIDMSSPPSFGVGVGCCLVTDFSFLLAKVSHLVGVEDKLPNTVTFDLRF
jgi:hypothetical protein